ncbi:MAG TPA: hypothetical protein VFZ66_08615 [Herpetosiphonaceae bacterium]
MFLPPPKPPTPPAPPSLSSVVRRSLRDRIIETLSYLSDEIDSRRVGGLGEAQAAGYVAGRLRRAEYAAAVQSFRASAGERLPLLALTTIGAAGGALAALRPETLWLAAAGLLVLLTIVLLLAEIEGPAPLRRMLKGTISQSVVAVRAAGARHARWRMIVLAPLDGSPTPTLSRQGLLLLLAALVVESIGVGALFFVTTYGWRLLAAACAGLVAAIGLWLLRRLVVPALLPAIHGAGELTTLLMVAEELEPLQAIEVWTVALGGGSVGHESIAALIEHYPFSPADTCIINLHNISAGQPVFVTREGLLRERRSDRMLLALAADADALDMTIDAEPRPLRQQTLAQAFHRQGLPAISITSHSDASVFANLDADTIERCVRLVVGMVRGLDAAEARKER